jgi:hypothetical protein
VSETRVLFEVADGELNDGVVAVEPVDRDGGGGQVGEERVMPPGRDQRGLVGVSEAGAAHDEAQPAVGALADLGEPALGVIDVDPPVLWDRRDGCVDGGIGPHGHGETDVQAAQGGAIALPGLLSRRSKRTGTEVPLRVLMSPCDPRMCWSDPVPSPTSGRLRSTHSPCRRGRCRRQRLPKPR